jgi:hypothetical protein
MAGISFSIKLIQGGTKSFSVSYNWKKQLYGLLITIFFSRWIKQKKEKKNRR